MPYWLTISAVSAIILGNLLIRAGMMGAAPAPARRLLAVPGDPRAGSWRSWRVWLGALLLLVGVIGWTIAVSLWRLDASYVALGLSFVATVVCAWWVLGETLTLEKMIGAIIIVIGMLLIARNSGS